MSDLVVRRGSHMMGLPTSPSTAMKTPVKLQPLTPSSSMDASIPLSASSPDERVMFIGEEYGDGVDLDFGHAR